MSTSFKTLIVFLAGVAAAAVFVSINQTPNITLQGSSNNSFSVPVTNSSTTIPIASTTILSANGNRVYASFCNPTGAGTVYLSFSTGAVLGEGISIASTTQVCYEIDADNLYLGPVFGIADVESSINTIEK